MKYEMCRAGRSLHYVNNSIRSNPTILAIGVVRHTNCSLVELYLEFHTTDFQFFEFFHASSGRSPRIFFKDLHYFIGRGTVVYFNDFFRYEIANVLLFNPNSSLSPVYKFKIQFTDTFLLKNFFIIDKLSTSLLHYCIFLDSTQKHSRFNHTRWNSIEEKK